MRRIRIEPLYLIWDEEKGSLRKAPDASPDLFHALGTRCPLDDLQQSIDLGH